ncbi:aminomethyl-transferring glycine dehydrogenase subunit GcvPB [Roseobacter ponti]|uniref:glycine dehydrogenase (aminomethyl-transferring) n=1 Tax=Roseobacter ponti TaxID=1891787 RepID=A0A858SY06_9RHOB|nr:aminomethyl-transferring glycine dehydrogenase subunit GcvPB [Roseobacter ponti]QJF52888.1 aminomethyl-transferring glycine dehydrogenase subunit GcvPA [Roseobacter ponti]
MWDQALQGVSDADRQVMLEALGLPDGDALFRQIPTEFRLSELPDMPPALSEWELTREMRARAQENTDCLEYACFLGAGVYAHHVPAVIDAIAARGEFLTAYTPYQPEMSQGLLSALNDFTTKISAVTGLPVVTSSHYDGATALAEATWMAVQKTGRQKIAVSPNLLPQYREVLDTYCRGRSVQIVPLDADPVTGETRDDAPGDDVAAIVLQSPNAFGVLERAEKLSAIARDTGALMIGAMHPHLVFRDGPRPADLFDILVFEGQPLGLHMFAGGAHLGILACRDELRRYTPGRLIGRVSDIFGRPALALVYEDREQHVARDRATSNICSNQALNALRAGAYMALYGSQGIAGFAARAARAAQTLRSALAALPGVSLPLSGAVFNEFVADFGTLERRNKVVDGLGAAGIFAGVPMERHPRLTPSQLLIATTETTGAETVRAYVAAVCDALNIAHKALAEPVKVPATDDGFYSHPDLEPVPEVGLVRRYTMYSRNNFGVDTGSYPLGSCTMKYNPKRNDLLTEQPGFQALHPLQPPETLSGLCRIYDELKTAIAALTGLDAVDLTPAAGAHGELKGLTIARRYFEDRGETLRTEVIIPDSAHGTNPASASMVGFTCRIVPTRADGLMDAQAFREVLSERTAVVMTTNPSTFGLFEEEIGDLAAAVHEAGALLYYDGANMNALMGHTSPGRMGFDIAHINLHKTFSTPHGGGGPGAGPISVRAFLAKYLTPGLSDPLAPDPLRIKLWYGHVSVLLRAWAYIRSLGADGLKQASADAVLNANYLMRALEPVIPPVFDRPCMHEALLDGSRLPVSTLDLAKRMIDFDVHPPTLVGAGCVYYGEDMAQAMLFEPTETESKADLDRLVRIITDILKEAREDASVAGNAPHTSPVARLVV